MWLTLMRLENMTWVKCCCWTKTLEGTCASARSSDWCRGQRMGDPSLVRFLICHLVILMCNFNTLQQIFWSFGSLRIDWVLLVVEETVDFQAPLPRTEKPTRSFPSKLVAGNSKLPCKSFPFRLLCPTEIREITHCYNFLGMWDEGSNHWLGSGLNFLAVEQELRREVGCR